MAIFKIQIYLSTTYNSIRQSKKHGCILVNSYVTLKGNIIRVMFTLAGTLLNSNTVHITLTNKYTIRTFFKNIFLNPFVIPPYI